MSAWKQGVWKPGVWKASVWGCITGPITVYNVVRTYVTTTFKRTARTVGKRTVTITEGVIK